MNIIWWQVAGWTMIHFLWIGSLVFLVTALVRLVLLRAAPQWRYAASLLGLAVLALSPPLVAWQLARDVKPIPVAVEPVAIATVDRYELPIIAPTSVPEVSAPAVIDLKYTPITVETPSVEASLEASPTESVVVSQAIAPPAPVSAEPLFDPQLLLQTLPSYLPWLWMVGTPATLLLLATGLMGSERLRRRAEPINDPALLETLARLSAALRIGRKVTLAVSDRVLQPVLVGIVRPLVLLPSVALTSWSPAEIEMALVHELAHVRRWDNLVNLVQRLVESLLFFHPAVWITSRWVRADREHCCDAVVVAHCGNREAYASLLVSVAKSSVTRRLPSPAMAMASHPLAKRVRRILQLEDDPMLVSKRTLLSVAVLLAALTVGAVWSSTLAEETKGEPEASAPEVEEVTTESTEDAEKEEAIILHPELTEAELADIRKKLADEGTGYTISVDGPFVFLRSNDGVVKATRIEIAGKEWRLKESETVNVPEEAGAVLVAWFQGFSLKDVMKFTATTVNALVRDGYAMQHKRSDWGIGLIVRREAIPASLPERNDLTVNMGYTLSADTPVDEVRELIQLCEQGGYIVAMGERGDRIEIRMWKRPKSVAEFGTDGTENPEKNTDQQVATTKVDQSKRALAAFYFANVGVGRGNYDPARHAERIAKHDAEFTSAKTLAEMVSRLKLANSINAEWLKDHLMIKRVNDLELQVSLECGPKDDINQGQVSEIVKEVVNAYFMRQFPNLDVAGHLWSAWHLHPKMEPEDFEKARKFFRENTDWTFRLRDNSVSLSARGDVFVFDEIMIVGDLIIGLAGSPQSIQAFTEAKNSTAKDEAEEKWIPINPTLNKLPFLSLEDQRIADLAYGMLGVEVAAIDAEELAAVKEKGFAGGVRLDEIPGYGGMSSSPAAGADLTPGDILVGLHVWPTADLDQLAEVLRRGDLNQFIPLKYFVLRRGTPGKFGNDPDLPAEDLWKLHSGRIAFDIDRWSQEQLRLKQIELKAERDAGKATLLPLPGQPGAVKAEAAEDKDAVERELAPPAATTPIAEPAEAEPTKPAPPQLLYDGRTFDDWRTEWKTELKTEKRTAAIAALAAFGRAGDGNEAAETILDVAGEYDPARMYSPESLKNLKEAIASVMTGSLQFMPSHEWLELLLARFNEAGTDEQRGRWTGWLVETMKTSSAGRPEMRAFLLDLIANSSEIQDPLLSKRMREQAVISLVRGDRDLQNEQVFQLVRSELNASPPNAELLIYTRFRFLDRLPEQVELLLHPDNTVRTTAQHALGNLGQQEGSPEVFEALLSVLADPKRGNDHAAAIEAIVAGANQLRGGRLDAMYSTIWGVLTDTVVEGDEAVVRLAASALAEIGVSSPHNIIHDLMANHPELSPERKKFLENVLNEIQGRGRR